MEKIDFLIVGAGLYGAVFARKAKDSGKTCLLVDSRPHLAGNIFTESIEGIQVHRYGAHIFHTNNDIVWKFITQFGKFNNFINSPVANYKGNIYNLPFNMNTFYQIWGVKTPQEALEKINEQRKICKIDAPKNLEEQAISLVGTDIYEKLIKGYTEKQWGRSCKELPASIIKRLPVRFLYDNNYFNAKYQGIPFDGYTKVIERLLEGIPVQLNTDYFLNKYSLDSIAKNIVFTGPIDRYFDYKYGHLEYRSLRFETEVLNLKNYQGVAVMNYTDRETPYTRVIEHKHFTHGEQPKTVISREYPIEWKLGEQPYYPINNDKNQEIYQKYLNEAVELKHVFFGGRLGLYKYYDMDKIIEQSLLLADRLL